MKTAASHYDLILIGSGLGNTLLATIMAKQGFSVLLIEKGSHPRFAIGESLVFRSALWMWMLGRIYDVPEISKLASLDDIAHEISPRCGSKLTFGFLYHRDGLEQQPAESNRIIPPVLKLLSETHFYREDIDLYLLNTAIQYGADYVDNCDVTEVFIDEKEGVKVYTREGSVVQGRYIVDGAGFRSPLAEQFGLRDAEPRCDTHSRAIFTLFKNVPAYDDTVPKGTFPKHTATWSEGTLHHVFDGGWIWVIPFDNHKKTTNELCSVGLMLDPRKYPVQEHLSPEEEFNTFIQRFPSVVKQMENAVPARPFVRTGRIQYSASACTGPRYCLLHHAFSFIDPIFSRGMMRTVESIYALVPRLTQALKNDDFSMEPFEYLNTMQEAQMRFTDQLVSNAYRSMASFPTWNALLHMWTGNELTSAVYLLRRAFLSVKTGSLEPLMDLDEYPRPGGGTPFYEEIQSIYDLCSQQLSLAEAGMISYEDAAAPLFEALDKATFLPRPLYGWGDPQATHADFAPPTALLKLLYWGKTHPSADLRARMTDLSAGTIFKMEIQGVKKAWKYRNAPLAAVPSLPQKVVLPQPERV